MERENENKTNGMENGNNGKGMVTVTSSTLAVAKARPTHEDDDDIPENLYNPEVILPPLFKVPGEMYIDPLKHKVHMAKLEAEAEKQRMNSQLRELVEKTGMPVVQENGQRRYGPPNNYLGAPPQKGSEVFIGKIPRDAFEPELVPLFSQVGRIYEMRIMMDFSGANRGYGFVQYFNPADANSAILYLNNYHIRPGKPIGVVRSVDNCRIYIGGIPKDKTRDQIFTEINRITEGVTRVLVYNDPVDKTKHRGFAFVEYESHKAAAMARRTMLPGKIPMWGINVNVDWAQPEPDTLTLFVKNLNETTPIEKLQAVFNANSENGVLRVTKTDDNAYISFNTPVQAEQARRVLHGCFLDGFKIDVCFARQKTSKHHIVPTHHQEQFQNVSQNQNQNWNHSGFPNYQRYHAPVQTSAPIPIQNQNYNNGYGNGNGYFSGQAPIMPNHAPMHAHVLGGFGPNNFHTNVMRAEPLQPLPTYFTQERCNGVPPPGYYFQ